MDAGFFWRLARVDLKRCARLVQADCNVECVSDCVSLIEVCDVSCRVVHHVVCLCVAVGSVVCGAAVGVTS